MALKISDCDLFLLKNKVYFDKSNGYFKIRINGKSLYLHRVIMNAKKGEIIDHINRDKEDCTRENLRKASKSLNNYNRDIKNKYGRGIYFDKFGSRFRACISFNNKNIKLGSFKSEVEAKKAYNKKSIEIYGSNAYQHCI